MTRAKQARNRNSARRASAATKQVPLSLAEQERRAAERKAARDARYPHPPLLDPFSQVRGEPSGNAEPVVIVPERYGPAARKLQRIDLLAAFNVEFLIRRARRQKSAA